MHNEIQFILYNLPEEEGKVQVIIRDETLWCTQKAMAQLFGVDRTVVSKHLKNIFESSELQQDSVCAKFAHTAEDGKIYNTQFYNLDAVISVGYHYAITGQTAAEIVYHNADHTKDYMGLTTWKNSPKGRILKSDVIVAKNYLQENEIKELELAISAFFDYIENLIRRRNTFNMEQFSGSVNKFIYGLSDFARRRAYFCCSGKSQGRTGV